MNNGDQSCFDVNNRDHENKCLPCPGGWRKPEKLNLQIKPYSKTFDVIYGDTQEIKGRLNKMRAKYNPRLKEIGKGWLFHNKRREEFEKMVKELTK